MFLSNSEIIKKLEAGQAVTANEFFSVLPTLTMFKLEEYIKSNPNLLTLKNLNGDTALHIAVQSNEPTLVNILLSAGISIDVKNNNNKTAEDIAIENSFTNIVSIIKGYAKQKSAQQFEAIAHSMQFEEYQQNINPSFSTGIHIPQPTSFSEKEKEEKKSSKSHSKSEKQSFTEKSRKKVKHSEKEEKKFDENLFVLQSFIDKGDIESFKQLLSQFPYLTTETFPEGFTLLHYAAAVAENLKFVEAILENLLKTDQATEIISMPDFKNNTAYDLATNKNEKEVAALIERYAALAQQESMIFEPTVTVTTPVIPSDERALVRKANACLKDIGNLLTILELIKEGSSQEFNPEQFFMMLAKIGELAKLSYNDTDPSYIRNHYGFDDRANQAIRPTGVSWENLALLADIFNPSVNYEGINKEEYWKIALAAKEDIQFDLKKLSLSILFILHDYEETLKQLLEALEKKSNPEYETQIKGLRSLLKLISELNFNRSGLNGELVAIVKLTDYFRDERGLTTISLCCDPQNAYNNSIFISDLNQRDNRYRVARLLVIIGETSHGISPQTKKIDPRIPFRKIVSSRNAFAHSLQLKLKKLDQNQPAIQIFTLVITEDIPKQLYPSILTLIQMHQGKKVYISEGKLDPHATWIKITDNIIIINPKLLKELEQAVSTEGRNSNKIAYEFSLKYLNPMICQELFGIDYATLEHDADVNKNPESLEKIRRVNLAAQQVKENLFESKGSQDSFTFRLEKSEGVFVECTLDFDTEQLEIIAQYYILKTVEEARDKKNLQVRELVKLRSELQEKKDSDTGFINAAKKLKSKTPLTIGELFSEKLELIQENEKLLHGVTPQYIDKVKGYRPIIVKLKKLIPADALLSSFIENKKNELQTTKSKKTVEEEIKMLEAFQTEYGDISIEKLIALLEREIADGLEKIKLYEMTTQAKTFTEFLNKFLSDNSRLDSAISILQNYLKMDPKELAVFLAKNGNDPSIKQENVHSKDGKILSEYAKVKGLELKP